MIKSRTKVFVLPTLLMVLTLGGLFFYDRQRPQNKAKRVVDKHLSSRKTGKGNPYSTVDITKIREVFINVIDYKYLSMKKIKVPEGPTIYDREFYKYVKDSYKTYEEFLDFYQEIYKDRAKRIEDKLIVDTDDYHYEYEFLYDLILANRLGLKLYKKYVFRVAPDILGGYQIISYYER